MTHRENMARLHPAALDRQLCPTLPGHVHFNVALGGTAFLRGLVEGEEVCSGFINVAGLLPAVLDKRAATYNTPQAISARKTLLQMCEAQYPDGSVGCMDALTASATCGPHAACVSARLFLANLVGANDEIPWGRASTPTDKKAFAEESRPVALR